jgi:hypothetical protein
MGGIVFAAKILHNKGGSVLKKIFLLTSLFFLLGFAGIVQAEPMCNYNVDIYVYGELINMPDQKPFIDSSVDRTYVPIRFISEALGAIIYWFESEQEITITKNGKTISFNIGSSIVDVDGTTKTIDAPPKLINGRTMVPLRFFSQVLGQQVNWITTDNGNKVEIVSNDSNSNDLLNENIIRNLFKNRLNEDGDNYTLDYVKWQIGSFSNYNATEALVSFHDHNQCHASGWSEVWLLSYDNNGWNIERKLGDSDRTEFEVIDLQNDGLLEVWITDRGGNQGYFLTGGYLLASFPENQESLVTIYSNSGFDYFGAGVEGEALSTHEMRFEDIDNDGILEIIDLHVRKFFAWTGEKYNSDYVEIASKSQEHVIKLADIINIRKGTGYRPSFVE